MSVTALSNFFSISIKLLFVCLLHLFNYFIKSVFTFYSLSEICTSAKSYY